jgi:hypothetical protein
LRKRAAEVASQIGALADKRKSYSLAASEGDARARKAIADADYERDALLKEAATVADALEIGEALTRQQALDAEAAQRRERSIEAYQAARGVVALNEEIDLALSRLREQFERRSIILRSLANTSICDPALLMRLANKAVPTSAAHRAGLGRFLNLEMTPIIAQRPLADSNVVLLGIGEAPPDTNGKGNSNGRVVINKRT